MSEIKPRIIEIEGTLSKDGICTVITPNRFLDSNSNIEFKVKLTPINEKWKYGNFDSSLFDDTGIYIGIPKRNTK
jgi:hypothetical protein